MSLPAKSTPMIEEEIPLNTIPGTGEMADDQNGNTCTQVIIYCRRTATFCAKDKDHRKLAIGSIICGMTCIGILALINSVKARETRERDPEMAQQYSHRAKKFGIISILVWVSILILTPTLMALVSYLFTLID